MASGAATLTAIATVLMILVLCSQGKPAAAAGEAVPCSQCASQCGSRSKVASFTTGPCNGVCLKGQCDNCRQKATQSCQKNCYSGCGHPSCAGCHCQQSCDCSDIVEASCDNSDCVPLYSQACQGCQRNYVTDCTNACKTNCVSG